MSEPSKPPGEALSSTLIQVLSQASAAIAVVGVTGYGLLSAGAARAYEAVGIEPREIGLSSGVVLAQTTIGIGVVVAIMLAPIGIPQWRRGLRAKHFALLAAVNLVCTAALVVIVSGQARRDFRAGHRTDPLIGVLALPTPWHAGIAKPSWVGAGRADQTPLPPCALYLGTSDGVSVIYDHARRRTLRLPASQVAIEIQPRKEEC